MLTRHTMIKRSTAAAASALVLAGSLAGCGSSDSKSASKGSSSSSSPAAAAAGGASADQGGQGSSGSNGSAAGEAGQQSAQPKPIAVPAAAQADIKAKLKKVGCSDQATQIQSPNAQAAKKGVIGGGICASGQDGYIFAKTKDSKAAKQLGSQLGLKKTDKYLLGNDWILVAVDAQSQTPKISMPALNKAKNKLGGELTSATA